MKALISYKCDARIFVFILAFLYKFILFEFAAGTIDHAQIASASPDLVEAYTCRSISTSNRIIRVC